MADIAPERMMLGGVLGPISAALYTLGFTQLYFGLVPDVGARLPAIAAVGLSLMMIIGGVYHALFPFTGFLAKACRDASAKSPLALPALTALVETHRRYLLYVYRWAAPPAMEARVRLVRRHARDRVPHVLDYSRARLLGAAQAASQAVQRGQRRTRWWADQPLEPRLLLHARVERAAPRRGAPVQPRLSVFIRMNTAGDRIIALAFRLFIGRSPRGPVSESSSAPVKPHVPSSLRFPALRTL